MTREEEAIILLSKHIDTSNYRNGAELEEALFIIANAIRHQNEGKTTNGDERMMFKKNRMRSIDADKLINLIEGHSKYSGDALLAAIICMAEGKEINRKITPLNEEKGKWIIDGALERCSYCSGFKNQLSESFCANCGAEMEE